MRKTCENPRCGRTYEAKTARSRFHSDVCRVQASRLPAVGDEGATVTQLAPRSTRKTSKPATRPTPPPEPRADVEPDPVVTVTTRDALVDAGRLDSPYGAAALLLAKRCDRAVLDTGSSTAALTKEWQRMLALALDGATAQESQLAQLRKVRLEQVRQGA